MTAWLRRLFRRPPTIADCLRAALAAPCEPLRAPDPSRGDPYSGVVTGPQLVTRTFQRAARAADAIVFVKGRLKFGVRRPNGRQRAASHPSALFLWNVDVLPFLHLGTVMEAAGSFCVPSRPDPWHSAPKEG